MRPAIDLSGLEYMPKAWQTKWQMIDTAEYDFWVDMIETTLKVARKIPNVTDDYLRKKAYAYRALMQFELGRARRLLESLALNPTTVLNLPLEHPTRQQYEALAKRARQFKSAYAAYAEVLYARLYLKGPDSIVAYIVKITVPEELNSRLQQMEEEFPSV